MVITTGIEKFRKCRQFTILILKLVPLNEVSSKGVGIVIR